MPPPPLPRRLRRRGAVGIPAHGRERPRMRSTPRRGRLAGPALALALPLLTAATAPERSVPYPIHAMGTYVNVTLVTADSAASAADAGAAHQAIRLVDSLMSNWTETSEVDGLVCGPGI